jgi:hypothetical protein
MNLKNTLGLTAIVIWIVFANTNLHAQQPTVDVPCRNIAPEDNSATSAEERAIPYCSPKEPVTCEEGNFYIDNTVGRKQTSRDMYLIVIARLGNRETSRQLNISRLKLVSNYLKMRGLKNIVTAEGERKKGYGQIEFYVKGKLFLTIPILQKKNIDLISCNAP